MGPELGAKLPGPLRLPDITKIFTQQISNAFVVRGAGDHITIGADRKQAVASAAALVAETVADRVEHTHRGRGVPHELHALTLTRFLNRLQMRTQLVVAHNQQLVERSAAGGDDQVHAEALVTQHLLYEAGHLATFHQVDPVDGGVGVGADAGILEMLHRRHGFREGMFHRRHLIMHSRRHPFQADLRRIQPGIRQAAGQFGIDAGAIADQVDPQPQRFCIRHKFR